MLSATKHLGPRVRSFAEFTLSETNVLRMTIVEVASVDANGATIKAIDSN
jgi:hypothetical protein